MSAYVRTHPDQMRTSLKAARTHSARADRRRRPLRIWNAARERGDVDIPRELVSFFISPYPDEVTVNMTRVTDIDPLDPDDLTRAEMEARSQTMQLLAFFRRSVPGFANARIAATATQIGIRESRRIVGDVHAHRSGYLEPRELFPTPSRAARIRSTSTIRRAPGRRRSGSRRMRRTRFRTAVWFLPKSNGCWSPAAAFRRPTKRSHRPGLTPTVMTLGQAAGTAAALSLSGNVAVRDLDPADLARALDRGRRRFAPGGRRRCLIRAARRRLPA